MCDLILADGRIIASCGKPCRARFLVGALVFINFFAAETPAFRHGEEPRSTLDFNQQTYM
jgi:hypothetical protein